jgi:hypothetical protein
MQYEWLDQVWLMPAKLTLAHKFKEETMNSISRRLFAVSKIQLPQWSTFSLGRRSSDTNAAYAQAFTIAFGPYARPSAAKPYDY